MYKKIIFTAAIFLFLPLFAKAATLNCPTDNGAGVGCSAGTYYCNGSCRLPASISGLCTGGVSTIPTSPTSGYDTCAAPTSCVSGYALCGSGYPKSCTPNNTTYSSSNCAVNGYDYCSGQCSSCNSGYSFCPTSHTCTLIRTNCGIGQTPDSCGGCVGSALSTLKFSFPESYSGGSIIQSSATNDLLTLFLTNTGRVGIGTSTPNASLHLFNTSVNAELDLQSIAGANNHWGLYNNALDNSFNIWGGSNYLTILRDGKVGIGSSTPTSLLSVNGTVAATSFLGTLNANNISAGDFGLNTGGGVFSFPDKVGVGITSPSAKLHVNGSVYFGGGNGDANSSGGYSTLDTLMVTGFFQNTTTFNELNYSQSNVTGSGVLTIFDRDLIKEALSGFDLSANKINIKKAVGKAIYPKIPVGWGNDWSLIDYGLGYVSTTAEIMTLKSNGNVGIGTMDPGTYRLKVAGDVAITGSLQTMTGSDFAEEFVVASPLEPGTVVVMADLGYKSVKPCSKENDSTVVGIVSDDPSIIAGRVNSKYKVVVAMMGVVKVKVADVNGSIKKGTLLTTSNLSGYAMKAEENLPGTIIGKALENLSTSRGEIKVLVNLQ